MNCPFKSLKLKLSVLSFPSCTVIYYRFIKVKKSGEKQRRSWSGSRSGSYGCEEEPSGLTKPSTQSLMSGTAPWRRSSSSPRRPDGPNKDTSLRGGGATGRVRASVCWSSEITRRAAEQTRPRSLGSFASLAPPHFSSSWKTKTASTRNSGRGIKKRPQSNYSRTPPVRLRLL